MQILSVLKRDFTGTLLFDGLPKRNLQLRALRNQIGDLTNEEDLFRSTLLENITLGNQKISLQRLLEVVDAVGLSEFVQKQPDGINAEVLPGGKNIPGSIQSKILVARAIIGNPRLLVVENPLGQTSRRDRAIIGTYLTDKSKPWTLICTTEDPDLAAMCDRLVILKAGSIVFDGTLLGARKTPHCEHVFRSSGLFSEE
jgi:ABC-type bacteriocin/lantibiotic exporter with double-glycine peptidase domain